MDFAWGVSALFLITALGVLKLAVPLHRDAATFLWIASQFDRGAVLYADVWDVKQPGIFLFNYLAGKLFGFTAIGVHLFELAWQLTLAVVMMVALRPVLRHGWLAAVAPAALLASYYVFSEPHQQAQLEILVALPLFAVAWLTCLPWQSGRSRTFGFFAAGVVAGVATAFKHILAPIPVAFLVTASVWLWRRREGSLGATLIVQAWLPFACGVILVWGSMAGAFWFLGAFEAFVHANFVYPVEALDQVAAAPVSRLAIALCILAAATAPWMLYAAFVVPCLRRPDEPLIFKQMAVWIAGGLLVILLQKSSWWTYHMLLLYAPIGVLAGRGVDLIVSSLQRSVDRRRLPAAALSALLVVPVLGAFAYPAGETGRRLLTALVTEHRGLDGYARAVSEDYAQAADAAEFLKRHAPAGPIYVFGDPTIHLLTGRPQALPVQGSAWGFYLRNQWQQLPPDLAAARPVWIFLEAHSRPAVEQNSPETMAFLATDYHVVWDTPYGRWYALTVAAQPAQQSPRRDHEA